MVKICKETRVNVYLLHFSVSSFLSDSIIVEKIDLGFAITSSALNAAETLTKIKETVKFIIKKYGVGNLRYAVITYGTDAKIVFSFKSNFTALERWLAVIDRIQIPKGQPALEGALVEAQELFQSSARKDAKSILVVIADKSPLGNKKIVDKETRALDIYGVRVIPVAIGREIDAEEIEDISPYIDVLVNASKDVDPKDLAAAIMKKVLKGT